MSPALWCLTTIAGSGVTTIVGALAVEHATWRRRERQRTAAALAAQTVDPVDAAYDTLPAGRPDQITAAEMAAALLDSDSLPDQPRAGRERAAMAAEMLAWLATLPTTEERRA